MMLPATIKCLTERSLDHLNVRTVETHAFAQELVPTLAPMPAHREGLHMLVNPVVRCEIPSRKVAPSARRLMQVQM